MGEATLFAGLIKNYSIRKTRHQTDKILQAGLLTISAFFSQARFGLQLQKFIHQAKESNPQSHRGSMYSIQSCQINDHT